MSKTVFVTFATPNFFPARASLLTSAKKHGLTDIRAFKSKHFVKTDFYREHIAITQQKRGAGYWLWKPYYIYEVLKTLNEGDILVYCDSGVDIVAPLDPLIEIAKTNKSGVVLFENYQGSSYFPRTQDIEVSNYNLYVEVNKNKYWAKRDAFVLMGLDSEQYWDSPQVDANFHIYRKCESAMNFVKEWLSYCCNEQILTDTENREGLPNFKNLFSHIHDQAVISLLAEKHQLELYRCASQFGNHYKPKEFRVEKEYLLLPYHQQPKLNSPYGTLLLHHRKKYMPFWMRYGTFVKIELEIFKSYWV